MKCPKCNYPMAYADGWKCPMCGPVNVLWVQGEVVDFPYEEIQLAMAKHYNNGFDIFPKFTCEHCGKRAMLETPNVLPAVVTCPECGKRHDLLKSGGNYRLVKANVTSEDMRRAWDVSDSAQYQKGR